jgi:hypothetical protein
MVTPVEVRAGHVQRAGRIAAAVLLSLFADGRFAPTTAIKHECFYLYDCTVIDRSVQIS